MQLLNSNGNVRFRQLGEATIVSFRVVVAVVRGAKVVREGRGGGERMRCRRQQERAGARGKRACLGRGGRPGQANYAKSPLPTQTGMTRGARGRRLRHRHSRRCRHPPLPWPPPPIVRIASVTRYCLHVSTSAPFAPEISFAVHESSETGGCRRYLRFQGLMFRRS